jgi:hypothetical protein
VVEVVAVVEVVGDVVGPPHPVAAVATTAAVAKTTRAFRFPTADISFLTSVR